MPIAKVPPSILCHIARTIKRVALEITNTYCDVVDRKKLSNPFRKFYTSYISPIFVVHYVKIDIKNKEAQKRCSVTYSIMCIQKTRGLESD